MLPEKRLAKRGKCRAVEARVPYRVLFSTRAVPTQPSPNPKCDEGASEAGLPYGVLANLRKMPGGVKP